MITCIEKRDGRKTDFDLDKITIAIKKSFKSIEVTKENLTDENYLELAKETLDSLEKDKLVTPTVEQIQDYVEKTLINRGYSDVAKSYILYRAERTRIRDVYKRLMKTFEDITYSDANKSDIKRENANIDGNSPMGTMLKYGSEGAKHFYKSFVLSSDHKNAHESGDIHIHDLDFYTLTTTCCQINLTKLFKDGFSTGHGVVREPNDIASYSSLACIAVQSNQNDQHGGQSIVNFDRGLTDGVKKTYIKKYNLNIVSYIEVLENIEVAEKCNDILKELNKNNIIPAIEEREKYSQMEKEAFLSIGICQENYEKVKEIAKRKSYEQVDKATYQAMESLLHNLNTMHSRAGAQTPFSSINYGLDTSVEGRMIIKNMLLVTERGLGNGETAIFPIQIFRVKEGINFNEGEPNYDLFKLACRVSAKRLFPNFSFQDAPFNLEYYDENNPDTEIAYMGCRTRVMSNIHDPSKAITSGRGNLSFTSINLPRIALKSKGNIDYFFSELDSKINLVVEQLLERFDIQGRKTIENFPFLMGQSIWIDSENLKQGDEIREVLKHGSLSIGFIGLAETLKVLTGYHHGESEEAQELGIKIISHMRKRMDDKAEETKLNFSLLATPAESLSGRFLEIDKKKFGIIEGVTDREYYTNGFHVPVYYNTNAYKKIQIEAPYHSLTNAGHITYIELPSDPSKNLDAFEKIIRYMKEQGIGYGSINHPLDRDPVCGFQGIIDDTCPKCGRSENDGKGDFQRIRRITGYLVGTLDRFNNAKRKEVDDRIKHNV